MLNIKPKGDSAMTFNPNDLIGWRDGCRMMASNVCAALRMAGEPVTPQNVLAFVNSLPLSVGDLTSVEWAGDFCGRCVKKAHTNGADERIKPVLEDFIRYFVGRSTIARWLLLDAFNGILGGITVDENKEPGDDAPAACA
jgi:hypothetical protein